MHVAETLVALGGAFLVCGLLARAGVRIGLPTIPLFMLAGIVFGPHTPGFALVDDPAELELSARLGLVFLLFLVFFFYSGFRHHENNSTIKIKNMQYIYPCKLRKRLYSGGCE